MNRLHRAAFTLVILILSFLLFRVIHHAYSLPRAERQPQLPPEQSENVQAKNVQSGNLQAENVQPQKPSPQEIAASMNTFWDDWDEDHCKNICEASWIACRLRNCDDVDGVRRPDEL